jgi:hypothetical protein
MMATVSRTVTRKPEAGRPARSVAPPLNRSPVVQQGGSAGRLLQSRLGNVGTMAYLNRAADGSTVQRAAGPAVESAMPATVATGLLAQWGLHPKLEVGAVDDPLEREADAVADRVMRMGDGACCGSCAGSEGCQRESAVLQRASQEDDKIQTETPVQRTPPDPLGSFDPGAAFEARLSTSDGGSPLPPSMRTFMEPRFGADFSGVRLHRGSEAASLNRAINAQAFTHGPNIYLGESNNNLGSSAGKQLLAHELAHTIQQGAAGTSDPVAAVADRSISSASAGLVGRRQRTIGNLLRATSALVQRSWISERIGWVKDALRATGVTPEGKRVPEPNWARSSPPGAYYILNGLALDDMVRILRALTPADRKMLSDNLDEHAARFDRSRLQLALANAATAPGDKAFRDRSESLHWAIRNGNYVDPPDGAFILLAAARSAERDRLLAALNSDAVDALIAHRDKANEVPHGADVMTVIDRSRAPLLEGDVVSINSNKYVIYNDEVRTGGSVSWVARNPGNIRMGDRFGAIPGKKYHTSSVGDFAIFPDETTGMIAIILVLQRFGHVTVSKAMDKYAPASDAGNDPDKYARIVAQRVGVGVGTFIDTFSDEQLAIFAEQIKAVEGWVPGTAYSRDDATLPIEVRRRL